MWSKFDKPYEGTQARWGNTFDDSFDFKNVLLMWAMWEKHFVFGPPHRNRGDAMGPTQIIVFECRANFKKYCFLQFSIRCRILKTMWWRKDFENIYYGCSVEKSQFLRPELNWIWLWRPTGSGCRRGSPRCWRTKRYPPKWSRQTCATDCSISAFSRTQSAHEWPRAMLKIHLALENAQGGAGEPGSLQEVLYEVPLG